MERGWEFVGGFCIVAKPTKPDTDRSSLQPGMHHVEHRRSERHCRENGQSNLTGCMTESIVLYCMTSFLQGKLGGVRLGSLGRFVSFVSCPDSTQEQTNSTHSHPLISISHRIPWLNISRSPQRRVFASNVKRGNKPGGSGR